MRACDVDEELYAELCASARARHDLAPTDEAPEQFCARLRQLLSARARLGVARAHGRHGGGGGLVELRWRRAVLRVRLEPLPAHTQPLRALLQLVPRGLPHAAARPRRLRGRLVLQRVRRALRRAGAPRLKGEAAATAPPTPPRRGLACTMRWRCLRERVCWWCGGDVTVFGLSRWMVGGIEGWNSHRASRLIYDDVAVLDCPVDGRWYRRLGWSPGKC
jgi:hypothetical protein